MKLIFLIVILVGLLGTGFGTAWSHNPFTSKPETQHEAPEPLIKSPVFAKIIIWQHQLKQKMSELIRVSRNEKSVKPLLLLTGFAFLYGLIHAAGPGHGKAVATSYVLSHRTTVSGGGVLFGLCFASIHALSGVVGVLGLRYIIERSVSDTLASVTTTTQIISFGLITVLGLGILAKHGCALLYTPSSHKDTRSKISGRKGAVAWALTVGLVPCPAVVMVMLFCLSMNASILGLLLAACISIGMATTISLVVIAIVIGKTGILSAIPNKHAVQVEGIIGLFSGAAISLFGSLFFMSAIISA